MFPKLIFVFSFFNFLLSLCCFNICDPPHSPFQSDQGVAMKEIHKKQLLGLQEVRVAAD